VTALFGRINGALANKPFEVNNDRDFSVREFLLRFDAIFSLNQEAFVRVGASRSRGREQAHVETIASNDAHRAHGLETYIVDLRGKRLRRVRNSS
jgi:hypothetical protein